jgi:hypothetical protein
MAFILTLYPQGFRKPWRFVDGFLSKSECGLAIGISAGNRRYVLAPLKQGIAVVFTPPKEVFSTMSMVVAMVK